MRQNESSRLGFTNDNDYIYYTFGGVFNAKPHRFALDVAWFRDRFNGALGQPAPQVGQKIDTVLIWPSWQGSFGPINAMAQGSFMVGTAKGGNLTGNPTMDVRSWVAIGYLEVDLNVVKPFVALIYGSGDPDPFENDLNGFSLPHRDITLISGHSFFSVLDTTSSFGERVTAAPARANYAGGTQCRHHVGNPFSTYIGNETHLDALGQQKINTPLSNPGC